MSITITTAKSKSKSKAKEQSLLPKVEAFVDPAEMTLEELADKYGELSDKVAAIQMRPEFTQLAEVTKQLQSRMEDLEPTDTATITGSKWLVEVGAAAMNNRKLVPGAIKTLQAILPAETFTTIAKVTITDIEKYCTPEQAAKVIDSDTGYSNKRKITAKHLA